MGRQIDQQLTKARYSGERSPTARYRISLDVPSIVALSVFSSATAEYQ